MKKWILLILAIILFGVFSIVRSCQRSSREIVNVYTDKEIEYFIGKFAKKFERNESKIEVRINNLKNISDYDIIITDEKESVKNLKKEFKSKDLFKDELVVIGRRRIENISQVANSTIAIPNYKTNIGKTGLDILAKLDNFSEISKKIEYKDDAISSLQSGGGKILKKTLIFLSLLIISSLSFSEGTNLESINQNTAVATETDTKPQKVTLDVKSVYDSLNIKGKIDYSIFQKAYLGYVQIPNKNPGVLVIIDYTKPSNEERFYVLDLNKKKLVYSTRVAHSKNSGLEIPLEFSDDPNSYQSSLGFFLTLGEYNGAYGYSLRLKGLEENINANAESRAIVIHGGDIVDDEYIKKFGFAGRSLGCPVLPAALTKEIVNYIKHGRVLFIYGNDEEYIEESLYLSKLAPVFEGKPQNIVEIEKPRETTKVVTATSTTSDSKVPTALNTPSVATTPTVENPDQKNISIMLDVIKKEAEYKQHLSFRKSEKFIDYFAVMKNVVEDNSTVKHSETITTNIKTEDSKNVEVLEKPKETKDTEKTEIIPENKVQVSEEPKKEDLKQEEIKKEEVKTEELKKEEPKKEEVKKLNRKYSEEVIRKSLGLGVKLKSKTK